MNELRQLTFTKDWNNPGDFPPTAENAAQARHNIQLLHDETKTYINDVLVPVVRSAALAADRAEAAAAKANAAIAGTVTVGAEAPEQTNGLWVDTGNGGVIKYYDKATGTWVPCAAQ